MFRTRFTRRIVLISLLSLVTSACYHPPYNNFRLYNRSTLVSAAIGAGVGTTVLTLNALYRNGKKNTIYELQRKGDIRFEEYGDTMTLIIPTDRYYVFNSARLNELCYRSLVQVVRLLRFYPDRVIYVAAFTDNVGSRYHKRMLTQGRAETMLTFLWSFGIKAQLLHAEGYGDQHDVSDNRLIHGSAQNRRVEIQWFNQPGPLRVPILRAPVMYFGRTK